MERIFLFFFVILLFVTWSRSNVYGQQTRSRDFSLSCILTSPCLESQKACQQPFQKNTPIKTFLCPRETLVRVSNQRHTKTPSGKTLLAIDSGSGVAISDNRGNVYILTAAHIFENGSDSIIIQHTSISNVSARIIHIDYAADIVLLQPESRLAIPTASISQSLPLQNDLVAIAGFGPKNVLQIFYGRTRDIVSFCKTNTSDIFKIECVVRQGDSGGPVFNEKHEIVGIVWGTDHHYSYATHCLAIRSFIERFDTNFFAFPKSAPRVLESTPFPKEIGLNVFDTSPKESNFYGRKIFQNFMFLYVIRHTKAIFQNIFQEIRTSMFSIINLFATILCYWLLNKKLSSKNNLTISKTSTKKPKRKS